MEVEVDLDIDEVEDEVKDGAEERVEKKADSDDVHFAEHSKLKAENEFLRQALDEARQDAAASHAIQQRIDARVSKVKSHLAFKERVPQALADDLHVLFALVSPPRSEEESRKAEQHEKELAEERERRISVLLEKKLQSKEKYIQDLKEYIAKLKTKLDTHKKFGKAMEEKNRQIAQELSRLGSFFQEVETLQNLDTPDEEEWEENIEAARLTAKRYKKEAQDLKELLARSEAENKDLRKKLAEQEKEEGKELENEVEGLTQLMVGLQGESDQPEDEDEEQDEKQEDDEADLFDDIEDLKSD